VTRLIGATRYGSCNKGTNSSRVPYLNPVKKVLPRTQPTYCSGHSKQELIISFIFSKARETFFPNYSPNSKMGQSTSRYAETNWATADGGLTKAEECLSDYMGPTETKTDLTLVKKGMTERQYEVQDKDGKVIFKTIRQDEVTEVLGFNIVPAFYVCDPSGKKLYFVTSQSTKREVWYFFVADKPVYPGQERDAAEKRNRPDIPLYKRAICSVNVTKDHCDIKFIEAGGAEKDVLEVEECKRIPAEYQSLPTGSTELCAFWKWDNDLAVHKVQLELAKGTDVALHVVMVVLENILRRSRGDEFMGGDAEWRKDRVGPTAGEDWTK
jgi:hypothetical protein